MRSLEEHRQQIQELLAKGRELRARLALRQCAEVGTSPIVDGTLWIHGGGTVRIGNRVRFNGSGAPIELHTFEGAVLCIGDDVCVNGGVSIEAHSSITIGEGAILEGYCKIIDNHFHAVRGDRHRRPPSSPVVIEPGVTIGRRAIVFPGAHVARDTVVRPYAVVRREVRVPVITTALMEG